MDTNVPTTVELQKTGSVQFLIRELDDAWKLLPASPGFWSGFETGEVHEACESNVQGALELVSLGHSTVRSTGGGIELSTLLRQLSASPFLPITIGIPALMYQLSKEPCGGGSVLEGPERQNLFLMRGEFGSHVVVVRWCMKRARWVALVHDQKTKMVCLPGDRLFYPVRPW